MGIIDVLVNKGLLNKRDITEIRSELSASGQTLESVLVKRGVNARDILNAKGESVGIPTAELANPHIPF